MFTLMHPLVPPGRLELPRQKTADFESAASTNSATGALTVNISTPPSTAQPIAKRPNVCQNYIVSGRGAAWLARLVWVQEARGSNPLVPTNKAFSAFFL